MFGITHVPVLTLLQLLFTTHLPPLSHKIVKLINTGIPCLVGSVDEDPDAICNMISHDLKKVVPVPTYGVSEPDPILIGSVFIGL